MSTPPKVFLLKMSEFLTVIFLQSTGLVDYLTRNGVITHTERQEIENFTTDRMKKLIGTWCKKSNVTMKHFLEALEAIERFDAIEDAYSMIVADCRIVANQLNVPAATIDVGLLTTSRALTIQARTNYS